MLKIKNLPDGMLTLPTVFAVGDKYNIFVPFSCPVVMWVKVGQMKYYDDCNGILRSNTNMHKAELPMSTLNKAGEYTVVFRKVFDRRPYFPILSEEYELTLPFRPVPSEGDINIYQVADAHNLVNEPIGAGRYFGEALDLLVLNGDIPNHSGEIENFNAICEIAAGITGGERATVFARGNHDARGIYAEDMPNYIPTKNGKTYYTFRVGSVWGMVLDGGEDKPDDHPEYGGTVCFHQFRLAQTEFIKEVIENADREYMAEGVKHRLIISHVAITNLLQPPFDIEQELYSEWARMMREEIKPSLMMCGHHHIHKVSLEGSDFDDLGQPCTVLVSSKPEFSQSEGEPSHFSGCALTLLENGTKKAVFNRDDGLILGETVFR